MNIAAFILMVIMSIIGALSNYIYKKILYKKGCSIGDNTEFIFGQPFIIIDANRYFKLLDERNELLLEEQAAIEAMKDQNDK